MKEVNVTDFRQHMPAYLAQVQRGHRFLVMSRGQAIAELGPPRAPAEEVAAARDLLKDSVLRFDEPTKPALDAADWEVLG